jgi:hypothetical protein
VLTLTVLGPKEAEMRIIGCDLHARQQAVAMLDKKTGEVVNMTVKVLARWHTLTIAVTPACFDS